MRQKETRALPSMMLRMVVLSIPKGKKERSLLEEDLQRINCYGLVGWLWCLKDETMVAELLMKKSNK